MILSKDEAIALRRKRIIWHLIGSTALGPALPCIVSHYAAEICLKSNLADFKQLKQIQQSHSICNHDRWLARLDELIAEARDNFMANRKEELDRRNIDASVRISDFDETKLRLSIPMINEQEFSSFQAETLTNSEVTSHIQVDLCLALVYRDLYDKGFYLSSGTKFGSDFLAYQGDPLRYHATFAVRLVPSSSDCVDFSKIDYNQINVLQRLCYSALKIPLFATILRNNDEHEPNVKYWTLKFRDNLDPESFHDSLKPIEPSCTWNYSTHFPGYARDTNKNDV